MSTKTPVRYGEFLPTVINDFFGPWNEWMENGNSLWAKTLSVPAVNVSENTNDFKVSLANMLTIRSETKEEKVEKEEKFTQKEYNYSSFSRSFTLPDGINKEKIEASYENGVLQLTLPKSDGAKKFSAKRIAIK